MSVRRPPSPRRSPRDRSSYRQKSGRRDSIHLPWAKLLGGMLIVSALAVLIWIVVRSPTNSSSSQTPVTLQNPLIMTTSTPSVNPTMTNTPSSSNILYSDDFTQGLDSAWEVGFGEWRMVNERLKVVSFVGEEAQIFVGNPEWEDYAVDFDAGTFNHDWLMGDDNSVAVYVRLQDRSNTMWFQVASHLAACGIKRDGHDTILHSMKEEIGTGNRHLRVEARNNNYEFLVNGNRVCLLEDNTYHTGGVGIWARQGEDSNEVWIDNFRVTQLP